MTRKLDPLAERFRRRIRGERLVGLSPEQVRQNVRLGADAADRDEWPLSVVDSNAAAAALVKATRARTDRKEQP